MPRPAESILKEREVLFRQGLRRCSKCSEIKGVSAFGKYSKGRDGLQNKCKECLNRQNREYMDYSNLPPEIKDKRRKEALASWHKLSPEQKRTRERKYALKKLYGITPDQFDEMLREQEGKCALCKEPFAETPHVDHCHTTGKVRGLLHTKCNTGIGMFGDNPQKLALAIEYLRAS